MTDRLGRLTLCQAIAMHADSAVSHREAELAGESKWAASLRLRRDALTKIIAGRIERLEKGVPCDA